MKLPVRSEQLAGDRRPDEGLLDYATRCWEEEFRDALVKIESTDVRNALFALKNLLDKGRAGP